MNDPSPRWEGIVWHHRRLLFFAAVILALGLGSLAVPQVGSLPGVPVVVVGLAAHGGSDRDRQSELKELATDVESFVSRLRADDGTPSEERLERIRDAAGEIDRDRSDELGRLSAAVDELTTVVSERERTFAERQRDLRTTNERLRATIEASPAALIALDLDGTVQLWNPAAERIFGWSEAEVLDEPLPTVPDGRDGELDDLHDRLESGERITRLETKRQRKDGSLIDVSLSKAPIRDPSGEIVGGMGALEDISDRKARERRLEALFENSPDMIDVLDTDGRIVDANRRFREELGYTEDELIGTCIWEHDREFDAADIERLLEEMTVGERRQFEGRLERSDGSTFPVEVHLIRTDLGDANRFVAICRDVTDRKERERDLRETKRRLELALETTGMGVWEWDLTTREIRWDETLEESLGLDSGSFDGTYEAFERRIHPDDRQRVEDAIEDAIENDHLYQTQFRVRHEDGSWRWVDVRGRVVTDGTDERMVGTHHDITERKAREQALRRYREFTDDVLDAIDDVFYVLDPDGNVRRWNETLVEVTGYSHEEIGSMNALDFFSEDGQPTIRRSIEEAFDTGTTHVEAEFLTRDGERIPYEFIATVMEDLDGNPVEVGIGRDISARKRYERELRERERQLSRLMDNVPGMVYRCRNERDWPFEFVSEGSADLTGYESEDLVDGDVSWTDDVLLERRQELWETVQNALEERDPFQMTYPIETADGDVRWLSERGRGVYDETGDVVAIEGVITDVTERIENERELERTTRMLEQSQQLANVGAWQLDSGEDVPELRWTDEVARIHGISPDGEIALERALEFYHPEDRPTIRRAVERAIDEGEPYDLEVRLCPADETDTRWVRTIGEPIRDDGDVVKLQGSFQDITDRKRRERELERYETIIQAIGDPVYTLDASGEIRFINDAIEDLAGYDPDAVVGGHVSEVLLPADLERAREEVRELLREGVPYGTVETKLVGADGGVIETEIHVALLPMEDGEFTGTAGVIRDITERKERQRDLERTTDLLERIQRMAKVGGWELDVREEPRTAIWTDELYRIHDLPRDTDPDLETTVQCYHPDDRPFVRDQLETAVETGTGYDFEARTLTGDDDVRWVRTMSEPIYEDGEPVTFRGSVQDISDRKRRELALESLHETARGLLNAETEPAVADLVVETAAALLDSADASAGVYLLDGETNRFDPVATTGNFAGSADGAPSIAVGDSDSVLWTTYVTGTQTVVDDAAIGDGSPLFDSDAPGGLLVPIGDHGVFVLVAPPSTIDDETRQLFETLVATTEAAFDRLESEATLRERDAELEARNRRLRRQIQITEIIRGIDQSLIGADSREEIERTVPERLVEADAVDFAWIGDLDASGTSLEPRTWAGSAPEYLDSLAFDLEGGSAEPAVRTARSGTSTVVENVVEGLQDEAWRRTAVDAGFQSVIAVPLRYEEYSYGVLAVYADQPDAFTDLERTVFTELGEGIANAINAAETRAALHSETLVELTLRLEGEGNGDGADVLSRIATRTGGTVTYEGLGSHSDSASVLFFEVETGTGDASAETVRGALEDLVSVTDYRLITESDDRCLFEATVTGDTVASRLVRHGASPRSIVADGEGLDVTADVPTTTDVREFVAMLGDHYADVDLRSRRNVTRAMQTRQELVTSLFEDLTDRQLEVLRTAYLAGFFEWPRESTGEEIAELLEVTQPTVNRHLRVGQQRLFDQLFGRETLSVVDVS